METGALPKYVEIIGMDESGQVGEPIIFTRVGMSPSSGYQMFLRNIDYFGMLMPSKYKLRQGYTEGYLLNYAKSIIDDPTLKVEVYKMLFETQLQLITELSLRTAQNLFQDRGLIAGLFDERSDIRKDYKEHLDEAFSALSALKKFQSPRMWLDSFVKSYGMMLITNRMAEKYKTFKKEGFNDYFWGIQIAGGFPFAFWWHDVLDKETVFQKGTCAIVGVSNGDEYYPLMSTAGAVSTALMKNQEKLHLYNIQPLEIDDNIDLSVFFAGHSKALTVPTFHKRIMFFGSINEDVRMCIPYLMHEKNNHEFFEATRIGVPIKWYLSTHGYGNQDNTFVVHGDSLSPRDKENITFCKSRGYDIRHVSDFKGDFAELFGNLAKEIEFAPTQRRTKLLASLKKIENGCSSEMK